MDLEKVSIPHRYGKNEKIGLEWGGRWKEFPFLIGTVRTIAKMIVDYLANMLFPFLIGTVRTDSNGDGLADGWGVSIPHRYGKNRPPIVRYFIYICVSIPHRYGKNSSCASIRNRPHKRFHSS